MVGNAAKILSFVGTYIVNWEVFLGPKLTNFRWRSWILRLLFWGFPVTSLGLWYDRFNVIGSPWSEPRTKLWVLLRTKGPIVVPFEYRARSWVSCLNQGPNHGFLIWIRNLTWVSSLNQQPHLSYQVTNWIHLQY